MGFVEKFCGLYDATNWIISVKAKLIAKGYKKQLLDVNRPAANQAAKRLAWDNQVDKAVGIIQMYMDPNIVQEFENLATPETLLNGIRVNYLPDERQEVDRLERKLIELMYDNTDPVLWVAKVRGLVTKLTAKQAAPSERTVRNLVL